MSTGLNQKETWLAVGTALFLGIFLLSFLPFCETLYQSLFRPLFGENVYLKMTIFPFLSLALFISLKASWSWDRIGLSFFAFSTPLPLFLSFLFGVLSRRYAATDAAPTSLYWYLVCIPVGEEFLFRGWAFSFFQRRYGSLSLWLSSLMFSLWHLQNLGTNAWFLVAFQVMYTFFTGYWLGTIRIKSGNPLLSTLSHSLLNLAAFVGP